MTSLPAQAFISQQSQRKPTVAMIKAQFGDGYASRSPDGLHPITDGWTVVWENVDQTTRDSIWTTFNTVGTWTKVDWQPFGESASKNWIFMEAPQETYSAGNIYTLTAPIAQVWDL